jgi:hypothetical protein
MKMFLNFCLIFFVLVVLVRSQEFNMFKNYANEKVKPKSYSKIARRHAMSEYMTKQQLDMAAQRQGKITAQNSFTNKWSGFDKNQGTPVVSRHLRGQLE